MIKNIYKIILCFSLTFCSIVGTIIYLNYLNNNKVYLDKPKIKIIDEESTSRAIAVSINNHHSAWPHSGLQDAFLCYELIAEGGITRILAFYKDSDVSKIGSVRSVRHYFLDYVLENDAIIVHYGFSPQAKKDIKELKIDNINGIYDSKSFYRDKSLNRKLEHTAFTDMDRINTAIIKNKYRTTSDVQLLDYSSDEVKMDDESKINANKITINYSNYQTTSYEYDVENKNYKLIMNNKIQYDLVTKKEYTVKNIITYQLKNTSLNDSKGRQDLQNIGEGFGYYITNGQAIKIKWIKDSRNSQTRYYKLDGTKLIVNDGNTWIHIQPKNKLLKIE
jgi:hypothetical protein